MKITMFAAVAALIAGSTFAHADRRGGQYGGAYYGPNQGVEEDYGGGIEGYVPQPPPLAPIGEVPRCERYDRPHILFCEITNITPYSATLVFHGTDQGFEAHEIANGPNGTYIQGFADRLERDGVCPGRVKYILPPAAVAPEVGGPAYGGPIGRGGPGGPFGGW